MEKPYYVYSTIKDGSFKIIKNKKFKKKELKMIKYVVIFI